MSEPSWSDLSTENWPQGMYEVVRRELKDSPCSFCDGRSVYVFAITETELVLNCVGCRRVGLDKRRFRLQIESKFLKTFKVGQQISAEVNGMQGTERRPHVDDLFIDKAFEYAKEKLKRRLAEKGQGTFASPTEALGAMLEEFAEYQRAIQTHDKDGEYEEAADIAVGAVFTMACHLAGTMEDI